MHLIFLSGGSGKRLWPLSNGVRSKQFLELLRADDGSMESMVQRVCRQIHGACGDTQWDSVTVVAGRAQADQLQMQLPSDVEVVIEPDRRDTFPAISYAAALLYSEKGVGKDEVIAVMPVDPFVDADYFDRIALIESEITKTGADIVLLGSKPEYPTEKFGYIIPEQEDEKISDSISRPVKGFKEKPDIPKAKSLISGGALWNCGVFGMRLGYVLDLLEKDHHITDFDKTYMDKAFTTLVKTSFDYEVVESAKHIRVIQYDSSWKDLGTWESLTQEMNQAVIGNVICDESCVHSHIINELDIPVVAIGTRNLVLVASPDGILVSDKDETYRLKEVTTPLENRPMYEKKRWGEYFVLSRSSSAAGDTLTKKLIINEGKQISYQYHNHRSEVWTIASGKGLVYIDGAKREIGPGETVSFNANVKHGLYAITDLELIETQFGYPLIEEDIIRLDTDWA